MESEKEGKLAINYSEPLANKKANGYRPTTTMKSVLAYFTFALACVFGFSLLPLYSWLGNCTMDEANTSYSINPNSGAIESVTLQGKIIARGASYQELIQALGRPRHVSSAENQSQETCVTYWINGSYYEFFFDFSSSDKIVFIYIDGGY